MVISNQVVASDLPGNINPFTKTFGSDEIGIVLLPYNEIAVEGLLGNLTDSDKVKMMEDEEEMGNCLLRGREMEGEITFIPKCIRFLTITPRRLAAMKDVPNRLSREEFVGHMGKANTTISQS